MRGRESNKDVLLVITADHGEEFFEHGKKGHQSSLYEEQVRIPLILVRPGVLPPALVIRETASITDIAPTLAAAAGAANGWRVQGRDLGPGWNGGRLDPSAHLLELLVDRNDWRALRTEEDKVMRVQLKDGPWEAGYHLVRDPRERRAIRGEEAWVGERLKVLDERVDDGAVLREKLGLQPRSHRYTAELNQRLGFLGYTESQPASPDNAPK